MKKATVPFCWKSKTIFPNYIIMKTIKQFWLKFYEKFTPKSLKHTSRIQDTSPNGWSQAVKTNCKQALPNLNILASSINRTMGRLTKPQSPSTTEFLNAFFRNISQPHYHPTSPKWNKRKPLLIPNLTPMYLDQLLHTVLSIILLEDSCFSTKF